MCVGVNKPPQATIMIMLPPGNSEGSVQQNAYYKGREYLDQVLEGVAPVSLFRPFSY